MLRRDHMKPEKSFQWYQTKKRHWISSVVEVLRLDDKPELANHGQQ
jgi:hypothetical protein